MKYELSEHLKKILKKLKKKDPEGHKAIKNKIKEIINSEDLGHYKSLRHDMKNQKRVHIRKSFVLVFEHDESEDVVRFLDYDHHDKIYLKYR